MTRADAATVKLSRDELSLLRDAFESRFESADDDELRDRGDDPDTVNTLGRKIERAYQSLQPWVVG